MGNSLGHLGAAGLLWALVDVYGLWFHTVSTPGPLGLPEARTWPRLTWASAHSLLLLDHSPRPPEFLYLERESILVTP